MGYKRRQKEIERQEKKRRRNFKRNNLVTEIHTPKYRQRIVPNKKKHNIVESSIINLLRDYSDE